MEALSSRKACAKATRNENGLRAALSHFLREGSVKAGRPVQNPPRAALLLMRSAPYPRLICRAKTVEERDEPHLHRRIGLSLS